MKKPDIKKIFKESSIFTKARAMNSALSLGAAAYLKKQGRDKEAGLMVISSLVWAAGVPQSYKNDQMRNELKRRQDKNKNQNNNKKNGPK